MASPLPPAPPQTTILDDENAHWNKGTAFPEESAMGAVAFLGASAFRSASSQLQNAKPSAAHDATKPSVFAAP